MGMDVNIYVEGSQDWPFIEDKDVIRWDTLADSREYAAFDVVAALGDISTSGAYGIFNYARTVEGGFTLNSVCRYYGPGYERGDWPRIYGAIMGLRYLFPECTIYYGSDHHRPFDEYDAVTDEYLKTIWRHWASSEGHAYRQRH